MASTYGYDHDDIYTLNSSNASIFAANDSSPTDFYDGFFKATQWTSTVDLNRDFDVGLHIVFQNRAAHDEYQVAPRHKEFIEENKGNWKKVRVFDSVVGK